MLSTHDKQMIPCIQSYSLGSVEHILNKSDVILINEGQFFQDLFDSVCKLVENNKIVHIPRGMPLRVTSNSESLFTKMKDEADFKSVFCFVKVTHLFE